MIVCSNAHFLLGYQIAFYGKVPGSRPVSAERFSDYSQSTVSTKLIAKGLALVHQ